MTRQGQIFLIALVCSLGLHVAGFLTYVDIVRTYGTHLRLARAGAASARPTTAPAKKPANDELIFYPEMGEDTGTGNASNASPGDKPLEAREADENQAPLDRVPAVAGRINAPPAHRDEPDGDGIGGAPAAAANLSPDPALSPRALSPPHPLPPVPEPAAPPVAVAALPEPQVKLASIAADLNPPLTPPQAPHPPVASAAQKPPPSPAAPPKAATGDGRAPGKPKPAVEAYEQSDSDSDPFLRKSGNVVVLENGRLDVRFGRKIKTTRPHVMVAGQFDLIALSNAMVCLEIHIAASGNVTDVKVSRSSGSNQIDEPTRLAVYDWWFEPAKDKHGKPIADITFFTIEYR
jgi:TonB family protein